MVLDRIAEIEARLRKLEGLPLIRDHVREIEEEAAKYKAEAGEEAKKAAEENHAAEVAANQAAAKAAAEKRKAEEAKV